MKIGLKDGEAFAFCKLSFPEGQPCIGDECTIYEKCWGNEDIVVSTRSQIK